ncbi:MAG: hypothetical protein ACQGVK_06475 [Myxococcota bacterium]
MLRSRSLTGVCALFGLFSWLAGPAAAEDLPDFDHWLNQQTMRPLATAVDNGASDKTVSAPARSRNTSSLVDTSSVSDLVGVALNLAALTGSSEGDNDVTAGITTVSGYAFYSAFSRIEPLDPVHYCSRGARLARRFSLTLGYEEDDDGEEGDLAGDAVVLGAKWNIWRENEACTSDMKGLVASLKGSAAAYSGLSMAAQDKLAELDDQTADAAFVNSLADPTRLAALLDAHGEELGRWIQEDYFSDPDRFEPFQTLDDQTRKQIEELRNGHRIAVDFLTKQRSGDLTDEYSARFIWDWSLDQHLSLVGNAAFNYQRISSNDDAYGGSLAARVDYTPFPKAAAFGPNPIRLSLSGEADWKSEKSDLYKGQLTLRIPLPFEAAQGIEIPISLTLANRTELADDTDMRGMIGFSVDSSQLFGLLNPLTNP